jgi:hypothetical protein
LYTRTETLRPVRIKKEKKLQGKNKKKTERKNQKRIGKTGGKKIVRHVVPSRKRALLRLPLRAPRALPGGNR